MVKAKSTKNCCFNGCKNPRRGNPGVSIGSRFCQFHIHKATINGFLSRVYGEMKSRVNGGSTKRPDLYKGKAVLPKEVFFIWARNHSDFLSLYKRWFISDFDRKLTPTVNRMNPVKGYTLDNIEWLTNSQNCGLAGGVKSAKQKKAIYELLGVNK